MFSIPINQKLSEPQFAEFLEFLKTHKDLIYDLYFTSRMPPFVQDAMGDIGDESIGLGNYNFDSHNAQRMACKSSADCMVSR